MRLLIYGINYEPEQIGIGKYSGEMGKWLAARGHQVRVVTAPPYYPEWKVSDQYSALSYRREIIGDVKVWRCPLWVPSTPSGLKRILHLASFAFTSLPIMLSQVFWRPDIILAVEPPLFCAPATWLCARLSGAKCWLHVQDFEVDAAFDLGIIRFAWMKRVISRVENWLMRRFDVVSSISNSMIERLRDKGVDMPVLFPNWVDVDHIYPLNYPSIFRGQLDIPESNIVFLYSGNMGEKQGLEIIIESAQQLLGMKNVDIVICGQGAAYGRLRDLAVGLENIHWLPLQPLDKLNDLLNMTDVHLLPQRADTADLVMPSKLTGMLASGKPVLATAFKGTQIAKVLESTGVIVPPENVGLLVDAMVGLAGNDEKRQQLGKSARNYAVENISRDALLLQFEESLQKCFSHKY